MHKITVTKICACFKKSGLENSFQFNSNDKALDCAIKLKSIMNENFCSKHKFEILKIFDDYIISTTKTEEKSLKCCGSGCCF